MMLKTLLVLVILLGAKSEATGRDHACVKFQVMHEQCQELLQGTNDTGVIAVPGQQRGFRPIKDGETVQKAEFWCVIFCARWPTEEESNLKVTPLTNQG